MTYQALESLRARIRRLEAAVRQPAGSGFEEVFSAKDGSGYTVGFTGVKSPAQLEDDLLNLFIWIWSLKDYLKEAYLRQGFEPREVEELVNRTQALQYVSDVANRAKHARPSDSRSGEFAELVEVGLEVPQTALSRLSVEAFSVGVEVAQPHEVKLCATVKLKNGDGFDAFSVLSEAVAAWESHALARLNGPASK
jgi:hypothetical protein